MKTCPFCGMEVPDDNATECSHCGRTINDTIPMLAVFPTSFIAAASAPSGDAEHGVSPGEQPAPVTGAALLPSSSAQVPDGNAADAELLMVPVLRLLSDPVSDGVARDYALGAENVTIGRAAICRVILPDDSLVSRLHAAVRYADARYEISDLDSSNGTLVNDVPITEPVALSDGDRITIGRHVLIFTRLAADVRQSPQLSAQTVANQELGELSQEEAIALTAQTSPPSPTVPLASAISTNAFGQAIGQIGLDTQAPIVEGAAPPFRPPEAQAPEARSASIRWGVESLDAPALVATAPDTGELENLWARLADATSLLTRLTESVAGRSKRRQRSIDSLLEYLDGVLTTLRPWRVPEEDGSTSPSRESLQTLFTIAQRAVDDPSHLDTVVSLARYARSFVDALRALQLSVVALDAVRGGIAQLRRYEHDLSGE